MDGIRRTRFIHCGVLRDVRRCFCYRFVRQHDVTGSAAVNASSDAHAAGDSGGSLDSWYGN